MSSENPGVTESDIAEAETEVVVVLGVGRLGVVTDDMVDAFGSLYAHRSPSARRRRQLLQVGRPPSHLTLRARHMSHAMPILWRFGRGSSDMMGGGA